MLFGTWFNIADADIHIKSDFSAKGFMKSLVEKHYFALGVFFAICTQRIHLIAEQNGRGAFYLVNPEKKQLFPRPKKLVKSQNNFNLLPKPNTHQIVVGPYGAMELQKRGRFELSLVGFESTIETLLQKFSSTFIHFW